MSEEKNAFDFEIPNLDDVIASPEEYDTAIETLGLLQKYLESKAVAVLSRKKGNINSASRCEAQCEEIYKQLPTWAKW